MRTLSPKMKFLSVPKARLLEMALQFHRIVEHAPDCDQRAVKWAIDEEMPRSLDDAVRTHCTVPTTAPMPTADVRPKLWPKKTAWTNRIGSDVDQCREDEALIADTSGAAELRV